MSVYQITVDDKAVTEQIQAIINDIYERELSVKYSNTNNEISQAVKDLIYSHKDEILDKVIDRATKEIVKKGIPKLLETVTME